MNICGGGVCVCDNYEYGETQCADASRPVFSGRIPDYRYYFDDDLGVVISVEPDEMKFNVKYYYDPDLTKPA